MRHVTLHVDGAEFLPRALAALKDIDAGCEFHAVRLVDGSVRLRATFTREVSWQQLVEAGLVEREPASVST